MGNGLIHMFTPLAEYLLNSNKSFKILELDHLNENKDLSYMIQ